jgi:hypothetical protein
MSDSDSVLEDLVEAIEDGDSCLVDSLLSDGSIVANARLPLTHSPPALVCAAGLGQKDVVDLLLRFGARIDDTDDDGRTACHVVSDVASPLKCWRCLLAQQPDLKLKCRMETHRLIIALGFDGLDHDMRMSAMLIEAGAPLDGSCRSASTCVQWPH